MSETVDTPRKDKGRETTEFAFQAEVARLLHLMVHSIYSERDVFLRELISNGADACDKLRYEAVTRAELLGDDPELCITLSTDADAHTLSVADNGIGMSREELIENLGTIARSGTVAFLEQVATEAQGPEPIGQFGVGFYSAFMVADKVEVSSRRAGAAEAYLWSSDGTGRFTVEPASEDMAAGLARGTRVRLHLKPDAHQYLEAAELERIVRRYSDHVSFPIRLQSTGAGAEPRQVNTASALWTRPKQELDADLYREFYRHVSGGFDEPALTVHYKAEGRHDYSVLLFVPSRPPFDLYDPTRKGRIKLYVRRVFVADDAEILPAYLRFARGVIDSQDMPLNISREMLQNNPIVAAIRKAATNRMLTELARFADNEPAKFNDVWQAFGAVLKEGLYDDPERRDRIFALARFRTTKGEGWRTLQDYVSELKANQTAIYYLVGDSLEQIEASPQLEGFRARGLEVLLLADPIDHFWVATALGFEGKPFRSVTQGDADLSNIPLLEEAEEPRTEPLPVEAALLGRLKSLLGEAVGDVRRSTRLVDSPACLVAPVGGPDLGLERLLERQAGADGQRPVLEVNFSHPLVRALADKPDADPQAFEDLGWLLLDEARILEGEPPCDPAAFAARVNRLVLAR